MSKLKPQDFTELEKAAQLSLFNDFKLPDKSGISNDKISQLLPEMEAPEDTPEEEKASSLVKGITTTIGKKDTITITAAFIFNEDIAETSRDISIEEQAITDAIIDLWKQGYNYVTPSQIFLQWRLFTTEEKKTRKVTPAEQLEVVSKVDKLRSIKVKLNLTELAKARGLDDISGSVEDTWLNLRKFTFNQKGAILDEESGEYTQTEWQRIAYQIISTPIIRQYQEALADTERLKLLSEGKDTAEAAKQAEHLQVITISKKILSIPGKRKTAARAIVSRYLVMRIEQLKSQANNYRQPTINLDTLIKKVSLDTPLKRDAAVKLVKEHLDHYKKLRYIYGYKENRGNKNKIISFTVQPNLDYID